MYLPVRHHSPACARMVRELILRERPRAVLIEGPADFNERLDELFLPHRLPISIYSYVRWDDGTGHGAYYPFCEYSPEWQALQTAREIGACVRFIDLPYARLARDDRRVHRYADGRLRASDYVQRLCAALEVDDFDAAWDFLFEQDAALPAEEVRQRSASFGEHLRAFEADSIAPYDLARERFMAAHIRAAQREFGAEHLAVVTGSYHTPALRLLAVDESIGEPELIWPPEIVERGVALTPYSYERLDQLCGYEAGMPSPGFYHAAWQAGPTETVHRTLLAALARRVRALQQPASTADLMAIEACAQGLAALRGHARIWRRDLIDAVIGALVKDDLHAQHPFLGELQLVLRGDRRGELAEGAPLPPLVREVRRLLEAADLEPKLARREVRLQLTDPQQFEHARLLHRLRVLEIPGFTHVAGTDFTQRADLSELFECWSLQWDVGQDPGLIECSRFGPTLPEAVAARLHESALQLQRSAALGARLLLDAVLAGVLNVAADLRIRLGQLIHEDSSLSSVTEALGHLFYLYARDDALGTRGAAPIGELLGAALPRALWLLEAGSGGAENAVVPVRQLRDAFERCGQALGLDRTDLVAVLTRVQADRHRSPATRGGCAGALWTLRCAQGEDIRRDLQLFAAPEQLGDYLSGLFALAREESQRDHALLGAIHDLVIGWDEAEYLTALPALRLAFMAFTPREKAHLADRLFASAADAGAAAVPLAVSSAEAAAAVAFEHRVFQLAAEYGIDLAPPPLRP